METCEELKAEFARLEDQLNKETSSGCTARYSIIRDMAICSMKIGYFCVDQSNQKTTWIDPVLELEQKVAK